MYGSVGLNNAICKPNSGHDHARSGGVSEANLSHDDSRDRDLPAKPESQSQSDHTNGGREDGGMLENCRSCLAEGIMHLRLAESTEIRQISVHTLTITMVSN